MSLSRPLDCHLSRTSLNDAASASFSVYIRVVTQNPPFAVFPPMEFIQKSLGRPSRGLLFGSLVSATHLFATKFRICSTSSL